MVIFDPKPIDSSEGLTKELSFLFIGRGNGKQGSITKITPELATEKYVEIVSEGLTSGGSSDAIKSLVNYVQNEHLKVISNIRKQLEVELHVNN